MYNSQGIIGFVQSGVTYTYRKNMFGDIVAIYQGNTKVAEYAYDAWGNQKVMNGNSIEVADLTHIAHVNPFRYRGYYWDNDLGLYYLMSRYYDPATGRFINADSLEYLDPEAIGELNLYAYCGNNPVMCADPSGHFSLPNWAKWVIGGVTFIGAVVLTCLTGGALAPVFIGMVGSILLEGVIEGTISAINGDDFWEGFANGTANGAMFGGLFALGGATLRTIKLFKNKIYIN